MNAVVEELALPIEPLDMGIVGVCNADENMGSYGRKRKRVRHVVSDRSCTMMEDTERKKPISIETPQRGGVEEVKMSTTTTPQISTPMASTPMASTPMASTPMASTPMASTPMASTPMPSTPTPSREIRPTKTDGHKKLKLNIQSNSDYSQSTTLLSPSPASIYNSAKFRSRTSPNRVSGRGTPPRSPRSPRSRPRRQSAQIEKPTPQIKQFYFPKGVPMSPNTVEREKALINRAFMLNQGADLTEEIFREVTTDVCGFSTYCNRTLFNKLDPSGSGKVSKSTFLKFWESQLQNYDNHARLFRLFKAGGRNYLKREDFNTLAQETLDRHPGLSFLQSSPVFHSRYVQTVVGRIFYHLNKSGNGKITEGELKRSSLPEALKKLDGEKDINEVYDFFSYEHFYVIYCKFYELDEDHDFEIDIDSLMRYGEYCHTKAVVQRVVEGIPRKLSSGKPGILTYEDFIPYIISSEDKTNSISIDYWFKCLDLDGDGVIAPYEIEHFFKEQQKRILHFSNEQVKFDDFLCQLNDMIKPKEEARFTRLDVQGSKLAGLFFDMIFNLSKFALYESRDPAHIEETRRTPELTDWDRFAITEYSHYAQVDSVSRSDEVAYSDDSGGSDVHDDQIRELQEPMDI